jgi:hypothetical protein
MGLRTFGVFTAVFLLSAADAGATIIDSFSDGDVWLNVSYRTGYRSASAQETGLADVIGDCRDVWLDWDSGGSSSAEVIADTTVGTGFYFTQSAGVAHATIVWDGDSTTRNIGHSLNQSLQGSSEDRFLLHIARVTDDSLTLRMKIYNTDGTLASATGDFVVSEGYDMDLSILYSAFTQSVSGTSGLAVFSQNVGAIVLEVDGAGHPGADIRINSIETAAPEPSTLALAVMGIGLCFGLSRRRRTA